MTVRWRWDQGRLEYFFFDNIRLVARSLVALDGVVLNDGPDPLRGPLMAGTGLSFPPNTYRVWRNFKRVFQLQLLATEVDGKLVCTELCHEIAGPRSETTADDFFLNLARRTYFPSPALEGYSPLAARVYPYCLVLKALVANVRERGQEYIDVDEVVQRLAGSDATGEESVDEIARLPRTSHTPEEAELRQIRELLRVISQLSFLKWTRPRLVLDVNIDDPFLNSVIQAVTPVVAPREPDARREILQLGRVQGTLVSPVGGLVLDVTDDERSFVEGDRVARFHYRIERSRTLRRQFFELTPQPWTCDVCLLNPPAKYPWVKNLLELHHVLPLASAIRLDAERTVLSDLVPICPNCHRSAHSYYTQWLRDRNQRDFASRDEARAVYDEAKSLVAS